MKYLIRDRGAKVKAHIWTGEDTACRMWSTGGLKKVRFIQTDDKGEHEVCHMCITVSEKLALPVGFEPTLTP